MDFMLNLLLNEFALNIYMVRGPQGQLLEQVHGSAGKTSLTSSPFSKIGCNE